MPQYLVDHRLIFDTGYYTGLPATFRTNRNIDVEYPLQALRPDHGLVQLIGCFVFVFLVDAALAPFGWCHIDSMFAVERKNAVEPGQVDPGLRNQGGQFGDEIQGFEYDMGGSITVGRFEQNSVSTLSSFSSLPPTKSTRSNLPGPACDK